MHSPSHRFSHIYRPTASPKAALLTGRKHFQRDVASASMPHRLSRPYSQTHGTSQTSETAGLPHLTKRSEVHMVDVSAKASTHRVAVAVGTVQFSNPRPYSLLVENSVEKGDVMAVARIAGIQAVKKTSELIPLAHNALPLEGIVVNVILEPGSNEKVEDVYGEAHPALGDLTIAEAMQRHDWGQSCGSICITATVTTTAKTGVEMEALTGVMGAALTIVDMVKSVDRNVEIREVKVVGKKGGRSGAHGCFAPHSAEAAT